MPGIPAGFESDESDYFDFDFHSDRKSQSSLTQVKQEKTPSVSISNACNGDSTHVDVWKITESDLVATFANGDVKGANDFIASGKNVNMTFKTGWTPLMHAARSCKFDVCLILLDAGANIEAQSDYMTPLLILCCHETFDEEELTRTGKLLIDRGANVNACDKHKTTVLMYCCRKSHVSMLDILREAGVDVHATDSRGWNALHHSCFLGYYEITVKLIEMGCDYRATNQAGCSPIDIAYAQGFGDLGSFLDSGCKGVVVKSNAPKYEPPKTLSDLELFLTGLDLQDLLPILEDQNSITFKQLLMLTDSELEKLGIVQMGHRKKILNGIHEVHKKEWDPRSFPHTSEFSKYLSCTDANKILGNIVTHTQYINSSVVYFTKQLKTDPTSFLSSARAEHTLTGVITTVNKSMEQLRELYHQMSVLNTELHTLGKIDPGEPVDLLPDYSTEQSLVSKHKFGALCLLSIGIPIFAIFVWRRKL